ncbi:MAG: family 78 glycoside hydrolase catalytic domain [Prevotella sp.]
MKKFFILLLLGLNMILGMPAWALTVSNLRVQTVSNPEGIDHAPEFSWKLQSDLRGVLQTAYRIVLTFDAAGREVVYDSGYIDSDQSVGVTLKDADLLPSMRYYWTVTVRDNKGHEAVSRERAYFDTGLMSTGWGDAVWIRATDAPYGQTVFKSGDVDDRSKTTDSGADRLRYTIDYDMHLVKASAAIVFGQTSGNTYYMWQINCNDLATPSVRHHVYTNGNMVWDDAPFTQFTKAQLVGSKHHYKIEVDGKLIKTYVDGILVDTYTDKHGGAPLGDMGMRIDPTHTGEEAYFDNIKQVVYDEAGKVQTVLHEDFETESDYFIGAKRESKDGSMMCHLQSVNGEKKLMQLPGDGVPMFRKTFKLNHKVQSAKLYTSALGVYDVYINGKRVGHVLPNGGTVYEEMKPGFTDFRSRQFYSSHDVTTLLRKGTNAIGAIVTSGWYSGGIAHRIAGSDKDLGIIAKLVVVFKDGTRQTIVSDDTWTSCKKGALMYSDIYNGEIYDARKYQNFSAPDYDASDWNAVAENHAFEGKLEAFRGPYVQVLGDHIQTVKTATLYEGTKDTGTDYGMVNVVTTQNGARPVTLKKGQTVCFDMGQNIVGWPAFTVKGKAGTRMHFVVTEMLNDTGAKSRGNDGAGGTPYLANLRSAKAEVYYTLNGNAKGESWHPSTTFYGFRYCTVTATEDVEIEKMEAWPISSSHEDTGDITTNSNILNQLVSNVRWGQRGNLLSIPTDCPQRDERQGWTADTHVFAQTGMYNANVESFYNKWLTDMEDGQKPDGVYPDIAPQTGYAPYGGAAWADAGIIVPWKNYLMYGHKNTIRNHYASMEKYMDWVAAQKGDGDYQGASTTYGDWVAYVETDKRYISMVYYAHDAELMAKMSRVLSSTDDDTYARKARKYEELCENIKHAIQKRYFNTDGSPKLTTQCSLVLALNFNIYKDEQQRQMLITRLDRSLRSTKDVLNTGFLGTSVLNQTLSGCGLNDHAYNLLLQRKNPSWLYPIDQGATTMWERWNSYTKDKGFQDPGMNSFNHYAYGAIGEWMYRYMIGIESDAENPGFKHIILQPTPDRRSVIPQNEERITHADGYYDSRYGRIASEWRSADGTSMDYTCEVPANTTATLYLPADATYAKTFKNGHASVDMTGIDYIGYEGGCVILNLGSGKYTFSNVRMADSARQ